MNKKISCFLLILHYGILLAQVASFDTTFNGTGKSSNCNVTLPYISLLNSSVLQSSGKIVDMGWNATSCSISLVRFNADGNIDSTFGINGVIENTMCNVFNSSTNNYPCQMSIQADDKIVIIGLQQSSVNKYWVIRLLPNGDLDTTFNNTGYLEISFGTVQDRGYCLTIQPDGKILVGGNTGNTAEFMNIARLNTNGTLDTTFGVNGAAKVAFSTLESTPISIAVQIDGKIVLGGYTVTASAQDFALARFNSDGTIDTTFGTNGKVITTVDYTRSDRISKILVEPDGKIVALGHTSDSDNPRMAMTRYLANGVLDTSFGTNGIMITLDAWGRAPSFARQIDGKYVLTGGGDAAIFEIYRYNHDGTIDTDFFNNGFLNPFPVSGQNGSNVLIQPDNKIVVTGITLTPDFTQNCATVVRLNAGTLSNDLFANVVPKVYPNPTKSSLFVDNLNNQYTKVLVYNCLGQEVVKSFVLQDDKMMVDLSDLPNGVYMVKLIGEGSDRVVRVLKQ